MDNRKELTWIKIVRDKDGVVSGECINKIFESLPVVIAEHFSNADVQLYETLTEIDLQDKMGEITNSKRYTHFLPIPKVPEE